MKYQVEIIQPGIVVELPHNGFVVRTPYKFIIEEEFKGVTETMFRVRGIVNYTINPINDEDIEAPHTFKVPKLSLKRPKSDLKIGGKMQAGSGSKLSF